MKPVNLKTKTSKPEKKSRLKMATQNPVNTIWYTKNYEKYMNILTINRSIYVGLKNNGKSSDKKPLNRFKPENFKFIISTSFNFFQTRI